MNTEKVKVSVLIASYNHARFVKQCIMSALNQSFKDLEVIVVDDGSSDNSAEVISSIRDPRINFSRFEQNRGACAATFAAYQKARGEFICILSSDDVWSHDKLEKQLNYLQQNSQVAAVFGRAKFIDENGAIISEKKIGALAESFKEPNKSRSEWVRHFFSHGNCLCHPSLMIRRHCYDDLGFYDNRLRQLPDFQMWLKLVKRYDFHILDDCLVNFRILNRELNTSSPTETNLVRHYNELYLITKEFFKDIPKELFRAAFLDLLVNRDFQSDIEYEIEQALLLLRPHERFGKIYNLIGYEKLFALLQDSRAKEIIAGDYKISDLDFQKYSSAVRAFDRDPLSKSNIDGRTLARELFRRVRSKTKISLVKTALGSFAKEKFETKGR